MSVTSGLWNTGAKSYDRIDRNGLSLGYLILVMFMCVDEGAKAE